MSDKMLTAREFVRQLWENDRNLSPADMLDSLGEAGYTLQTIGDPNKSAYGNVRDWITDFIETSAKV